MLSTLGYSVRRGSLGDIEVVRALHDSCSDDALYRRFHASGRHLPEHRIARLLVPTDGCSFLCFRGDEPVALALAARISPTGADAGLLVADDHQGRGIGTNLLRALVLASSVGGLTSLHCVIQRDNRDMLGLVSAVGFPYLVTPVDGHLDATITVPSRASFLRVGS